MVIPEITAQELAALKNEKADIFILDVRNPDEYAVCNLGGYLIPLNELESRLNELNPDQMIIVHCQAGGRSSRATALLIQKGFKKVFNLKGGMKAWSAEV